MRFDRIGLMEKYILEKGNATLSDLSDHFHISIHTVRKDVQELTNQGKVKKIYGGVMANSNNKLSPVAVRVMRNHDAKSCIGRAAAELVQENSNIFLDSGSTVVEMVPYLANKKNITIVTHSLTVLNAAAAYPALRLIALGGTYNATTASFWGRATLESMQNINLSMAFLSTSGISLENGLMNSTDFEAEIKGTIITRSKYNVVLADSAKFDSLALFSFSPLSAISAVVTEKIPSEAYITRFRQNNVHLICPPFENSLPSDLPTP